MHRRRRNQRGVEVLLCVLLVLLLRRVFYAHKREREGEARERFERETWLRNATETTMRWRRQRRRSERRRRKIALTVKQRHFPQSAGVHLRADAGERAHEGCRRREKHSIIVITILRFFCDDVTTSCIRFSYSFFKLFSLVSLSDSLVASWVRWWWRWWRSMLFANDDKK